MVEGSELTINQAALVNDLLRQPEADANELQCIGSMFNFEPRTSGEKR
jgi:hypothetical protein